MVFGLRLLHESCRAFRDLRVRLKDRQKRTRFDWVISLRSCCWNTELSSPNENSSDSIVELFIRIKATYKEDAKQHTRRMQRMGSKEIILFLLVCLHSYYPASCLPLGKNLTSARSLDDAGEKETGEYNTSIRDGKIIAHRSNFASGTAAGRGGSSSRGGGGSGEEANGGSSTPKTAGIIPLYAAGAGHHTNHRGAASCNRIPALWAVILASLVVHIYVVLGSENLV